MRILYISHSFPLPGAPLSNIGGMQRVAVDLHRALQRHPDVELKTLALETSWRATGLRTPPFLLSLLRRVPAAVTRQRTELVLFSSMVTASTALLIHERVHRAGALLAAIPVGRDLTLPNPLYQRLVRRILGRLDLIFPISRATATAALERGAEPARVHVVPCGVELAPSRDGGDGVRDRGALVEALEARGLSVGEGEKLLLSVGRHQERKGFHWFVDEVVPRLPESYRYLLAGAGPMTSSIRERIERRRLGSRVALLGQVSEEMLALLYRGCDLFIMPNIPVAGDIEGFGVVMIEAGAAGLPVVASDLEGIRDVVETGENGWLVPSGDAAAFVSEIRRYCESDGTEARVAAERYVRRTFGWDPIVTRYLELVRSRRAALSGR